MQSLNQIITVATQLHVDNINNDLPYSIQDVYDVVIDLSGEYPYLDSLIQQHQLDFQEQVILMLTLAPYLSPQSLDIFLAKNPSFDIICTEFGGITQAPHRGVIPTGETAVFILASRHLDLRKEVAQKLLPEAKLSSLNLVEMESVKSGMPLLSGKLVPNEDLIQQLLYNEIKLPQLSPNFPAQQLTTDLEWTDLIIPSNTRDQLEDLQNWLTYQDQLEQHPELGRRMKKGFRTLFHGPPGTGKTLTASLLGKASNRTVFRIDLSLLVSKYIGETEKNLSGIFKRAEHKNWILFFDEAEALFSKRTNTESSNDRFANQEIAYLLQRIEDYNGMVILATNLKQNLDKAFVRRFQSMIYFPKPGKNERELIWQNIVPSDLPLSMDIDVNLLVENYELTASQISNIVQNCFITAYASQENEITRNNLLKNIRSELAKEELIFEELI